MKRAPQSETADATYMRRALRLARRGGRAVRPNPQVGAVLVCGGRVVGEGYHARFGGPHAETGALAQAGERARGATLYVNLEPCAHHGKTPPCADALIAAGIARVVVAHSDPNPRVAGSGLERLRGAGIIVEVGLEREPAQELNRVFLTWVTQDRPYVTLKLAQSLDGRVAAADGSSRWISGAPARDLVHRLRREADAVMVGIGTALIDDPRLTVRRVAGRSPIRIVLDRALRLPSQARLLDSAAPTWILTGADAPARRADELGRTGARILKLESEGTLDLKAALSRLAHEGISDLLVEGGPRLVTGLIQARLWDRLLLFVAPKLLGGDALPWLGPLGLGRVGESPGIEIVSSRRVGPDILLEVRPAVDSGRSEG